MKLAINYSRPAALLAGQGQLPVDLFKCHSNRDWIAEAAQVRPVCVHFPLQLGDPLFSSFDWSLVDELCSDTNTFYINAHLNAEREWFAEGAEAEVVDRFSQAMTLLVERYGRTRIIVENVVYRGEDDKWLSHCVQPGVTSTIIDGFGVGLLLDLAHARISARCLGLDAREYIQSLPLARLREMHVCGVDTESARWRDSMPMSAEDWQLAEWAFESIGRQEWPCPWMTAIEYGGLGDKFEWRSDPAEIRDSTERLRALIARHGLAGPDAV